jgi:CHAD domain-containing protein
VSHRSDIAETVRNAIARGYERLLDNEAGVIEGTDPEAVHQARVATRRLRSDLRTFEPFLDTRFTAELRGELRWLGAELGAVRDCEVLRDRLREHATQLPHGEQDAVRYVLRRIDADREAERRVLVASMRTSRYAQLKALLCEASHRPAFVPDLHTFKRRELRRVVNKQWKQLDQAAKKLGHDPSDDALHGVRRRAKKTRYAAEACVPLFGKSARQFAAAVENVQEILGEQHDAVIALAWLAKTAPECTAGEAYALGRLAQIEADASVAARREFRSVWKRARHSSLRSWL